MATYELLDGHLGAPRWTSQMEYESNIGAGHLISGMLNLSGIFGLNLSEMAYAGFYHKNINGVELVRNYMVEFV